MAFPRNFWNQLKSITSGQFIDALTKDGWQLDGTRGATQAFIKSNGSRRRIVIHYHPRKVYGSQLLKGLVADTGWTQADLKRLKLVK